MVIKYSALKQKDLDYMKFILRNSVVTAKHLLFNFQENNIDAVYRRLRKLKDQGYIKHRRIAHKVGVYIGTKAARDITEAKVTVPDSVSLYTIQHALLMTDLVLYHELQARKHGRDFSYKTEREIRYESLQGTIPGKAIVTKVNEIKERIPDCLFFVTVNGNTQKIWVELELNKKEQKRYDEKFKEMLDPAISKGEYTHVWYFIEAQKIKDAVISAKKKLMNGDKILVKNIPDVILNDTWEEVLPNGATNGESKGNGESGPGN